MKQDGILRTKKQALAYAARLASMTGTKHHVFVVAEGTAAHDLGYRFGTCSDDEHADYAANGATFVQNP